MEKDSFTAVVEEGKDFKEDSKFLGAVERKLTKQLGRGATKKVLLGRPRLRSQQDESHEPEYPATINAYSVPEWRELEDDTLSMMHDVLELAKKATPDDEVIIEVYDAAMFEPSMTDHGPQDGYYDTIGGDADPLECRLGFVAVQWLNRPTAPSTP